MTVSGPLAIRNSHGNQVACTWRPGLQGRATGTARSAAFRIGWPIIQFRIGGGEDPVKLAVRLYVDGKLMFSDTGSGSDNLRVVRWDVRAYQDRTGVIEMVDRSEDPDHGYLIVGDIRFCSESSNPATGSQKLPAARPVTNNATSKQPFSSGPFAPTLPKYKGPMTDWERKVMRVIRYYRHQMGLPDFVWNPVLAEAARLHTEYAWRNRVAHEETPGTPGFRGKNPTARAHAAGYPGGVSEDMHMGYGADDPKLFISGLFTVPYHRTLFTTPLGEIGAGLYKDWVTLDRAEAGTGIVVYPAEGQVGVPTRGAVIEDPMPMRIHPDFDLKEHLIPNGVKVVDYVQPVGWVISYQVFGATASIDEFRLRTESGAAVPAWINTPNNDNFIRNEAFLIPRSPLSPGTTYVATVRATAQDGRDLSREWQFTTGTGSTGLQAEEARMLHPASGEMRWEGYAAKIDGGAFILQRVAKTKMESFKISLHGVPVRRAEDPLDLDDANPTLTSGAHVVVLGKESPAGNVRARIVLLKSAR